LIASITHLILEGTPDDIQVKSPSTGASAASPPEAPGIFTAIQEQLGLKLISGSNLVEMLVIESAEKPSEY
jgi:uncharacterized protein (TIGR03435 family)